MYLWHVCVVVTTSLCICLGHKYSEEYNRESSNDEGELRAKLFNFIWEKASRRLNPEQKRTFLPRLTELDKEFIRSKHQTAVAKDGATLFSKSIDGRVASLLTEYGLGKVWESVRMQKDAEKDQPHLAKTERGDFQPKDKKLKTLWKQVQQLGFDRDESLRMDFIRLDREVQDYREFASKLATPKENSVLNEVDANRHAAEMQSSLRQKFITMQDDFSKLTQRINELTKSADGMFSHPRVQLLWMKVKGMNLPESELKTIVDELKELEKRVEKLQFFEKEVEQSAYYLNQLGKNHIKSLQHKELTDKVDDYNRKIAKYEQYILGKIHTEL